MNSPSSGFLKNDFEISQSSVWVVRVLVIVGDLFSPYRSWLRIFPGQSLVCASHPLPCHVRSDRTAHDRNGRCVSGCASNSSLLTLAGSALWVSVFPHSLPTGIGVASGSGTEIGGASTANLATLGFGHNCAPSVCSVAEHGKQCTPRCFSSFAAFGSFTHVLTYSPLWTEHEPTARLRCLANAHEWKTDICFVVSELKLATISQTETSVESCNGATVKSSVAH